MALPTGFPFILFYCVSPLSLRVDAIQVFFIRFKEKSMRKSLLFAVFFVGVLLWQKAAAQETSKTPGAKNRLGIRFGNSDALVNNSISYQRFFKPNLAAEALLSLGGAGAIGLLLEKHKPLRKEGLTWFVGGGVYTAFRAGEGAFPTKENHQRYGLQGIVGLDFVFPGLPANLSVDWKPELNLVKEFTFEPAALGFGARFVF